MKKAAKYPRRELAPSGMNRWKEADGSGDSQKSHGSISLSEYPQFTPLSQVIL
jgi:hypothetical protein